MTISCQNSAEQICGQTKTNRSQNHRRLWQICVQNTVHWNQNKSVLILWKVLTRRQGGRLEILMMMIMLFIFYWTQATFSPWFPWWVPWWYWVYNDDNDVYLPLNTNKIATCWWFSSVTMISQGGTLFPKDLQVERSRGIKLITYDHHHHHHYTIIIIIYTTIIIIR